MNGDQLSGWTNEKPATMKNRTAASLIATIAALNRALSRTPITRSAVMSRTMIAAGRVATPPGGGDPKPGGDGLEVAPPADCCRHRADRVLEDEVPANHPRED